MGEAAEVVDRGDEYTPPETAAESPEPVEPVEESPAQETAPTDEPAPVTEESSAEEEKPKEHMIPKGRFDQAVQRERAEKEQALARIKEFESREAQREQAVDTAASQAKLKELVKEHTSLLADGELDKASSVMESILTLQADMASARAEAAAETARNSAKQEVQYDAVVERLETEYPEINPDSESFDRDAVRRVQVMVTGLMQSERKSPAAALQEAVDILLKPAKEAAKAAAESLRTEPSQEAADTGMRRKETAVQKAVEANKQQPPSTKDVGLDHDKEGGALDASAVMRMTHEEFLNLSDDQLAKMRGDYVE